jgi:L-asparaginase II
VRELGQTERIRMNCSGKHAAMLLACRASGWDTETYLDPAHRSSCTSARVERLTGAKITVTAIDGCGHPCTR